MHIVKYYLRIVIVAFIITSVCAACKEKTIWPIQIFKFETIPGIYVELVYEDSNLVAISHFNKDNSKNVLRTYRFNYYSGAPTSVFENIGDSLLKSTYYYGCNIELITYDKDLKIFDTIDKGHGRFKKFYPNGQLRTEWTMKNGKQVDTTWYYDSTGVLHGIKVIPQED